jgi:hypothetical protein
VGIRAPIEVIDADLEIGAPKTIEAARVYLTAQ